MNRRRRTALTTGSSLTNAETPLLSFPLSYIRSGYYNFDTTSLASRTMSSVSWQSRPHTNGIFSYVLAFSKYFLPSDNWYKGYGFALRYVARPNREKTALTTGSSLTNADTPLLSFPLSYIRSGYYEWNTSELEWRIWIADLWTSITNPNARSQSFNFSDRNNRMYTFQVGYGFALRCVARINREESPSPPAPASRTPTRLYSLFRYRI